MMSLVLHKHVQPILLQCLAGHLNGYIKSKRRRLLHDRHDTRGEQEAGKEPEPISGNLTVTLGIQQQPPDMQSREDLPVLPDAVTEVAISPRHASKGSQESVDESQRHKNAEREQARAESKQLRLAVKEMRRSSFCHCYPKGYIKAIKGLNPTMLLT